MASPRFVISRSTDNQYYFNLVAANSEKILTSERYVSRSGAVNGVESVKTNAPFDERYDRLPSGSQFYFTLRSGNGQVIGVSERYPTRASREAGIDAVKRNASVAEVVDG